METKYDAPFQPIKNVPRLTGFSEHFVREGVKSGAIPHVRVGVKILVDVPRDVYKRQETIFSKNNPFNPVDPTLPISSLSQRMHAQVLSG